MSNEQKQREELEQERARKLREEEKPQTWKHPDEQAVEGRTDGGLPEKQLLRHPGHVAFEHQGFKAHHQIDVGLAGVTGLLLLPLTQTQGGQRGHHMSVGLLTSLPWIAAAAGATDDVGKTHAEQEIPGSPRPLLAVEPVGEVQHHPGKQAGFGNAQQQAQDIS